jgi:stage II sporulation protein AA (anti-sigma F factor antagonist)
VIETQLLAGSSIVCRPSGRLDWIAAVSLRHVIGDSLRPGVEVIIDLSRVEFIDAVGMSAIAGTVRRVRAVGGQTEIRGASPEVRRRLELAGVYRFVMRCSATTGNDAA